MESAIAQVRQITGAMDTAQLARFPIFHFDLTPILELSGSSHIRDPERLQVICRHSLGQLGDRDLTLFDSNGFFLVVGSCPSLQAEALANRINVALLKLFFGTESLRPDQLVMLFRKAAAAEISPGLSLHMQPMADPAPLVAEPHFPFPGADKSNFSTRCETLAHRGTFGDHTSMAFIPAYDLKRGAPAVFLCVSMGLKDGRTVYGRAAFGDVEPEQSPLLDEAILRYATRFADDLLRSGTNAAVTAPVSMETLGWSRGRSQYGRVLSELGIRERPHVVPMLDDLPSGAPAIRIGEITTALRPHLRRMAVALPDCDTKLEGSGQLGIAGCVLSLPRRSELNIVSRAAIWLNRTSAAQNAFSCITDINSEEGLEIVKAAGIRFGAGTALAPRALSGESALEFARLITRLPETRPELISA